MVQPFRQLHRRQEVHTKSLTHVFTKLHDREYIYLLLYVDNMFIASKSRSAIDKLKKQLFFVFEIKDLGEAKKILGMRLRETKKVVRFA